MPVRALKQYGSLRPIERFEGLIGNILMPVRALRRDVLRPRLDQQTSEVCADFGSLPVSPRPWQSPPPFAIVAPLAFC